MKCSVIQSEEKILTAAMKPDHKGLRWSRERVNERERKMKLKVIILVESPTNPSSVCAAKISLCVYGLLPALLRGLSQSVNPHTVHQQPRWLPSASCRYSLQLFSIRRLLTPRGGSSAVPAADMSRFQRKQNKSPQKKRAIT